MPKLSEILFGKKDKVKQAKTLTPEQEQLMTLISQGLTNGEGAFGDLFGGFNKEQFEEGVTKPALENFKENILPMLQEKFIAGNQVGGSGMQNAQLKAARGLQSDLAQLMYQGQQDALKNKLAGLQTQLGTRGFENIYKQGSGGAVQGFVQGAGRGLGNAIGNNIGNLFGGGGGGGDQGGGPSQLAAMAAKAAVAG